MPGSITWTVTFKRENDVLTVRYPGWMASQDATKDDVDRYMKRHRFVAGTQTIDGEITTITYKREFDVTPLDKDIP